MDKLTIEVTVTEAAALLQLVNAGREALDDSLTAEDIFVVHSLSTKLNGALEGRLAGEEE